MNSGVWSLDRIGQKRIDSASPEKFAWAWKWTIPSLHCRIHAIMLRLGPSSNIKAAVFARYVAEFDVLVKIWVLGYRSIEAIRLEIFIVRYRVKAMVFQSLRRYQFYLRWLDPSSDIVSLLEISCSVVPGMRANLRESFAGSFVLGRIRAILLHENKLKFGICHFVNPRCKGRAEAGLSLEPLRFSAVFQEIKE
jgi:hypothetical protein